MSLRTGMWQIMVGLSLLSFAVDQAAAQGGPPWAGRGGRFGRGPAAAEQGRGPGRGQGWANQAGGPARGMAAATQAGPGRGPGWGRQGGGPDAQFAADRDVFHALLQSHDQIRRKVKNTKQGVETVTESDNPEIAAKIQEHVAAMAKRVEEKRPIHMRDPLFAELFRHADKIHLKYDQTSKGVRVVETSDDPYVVKLIQAHGGVVSLFVQNGFEEARKNHEVPAGQGAPAAASTTATGPAPNAAGPCAGCPLNAAGQCPKAAAGQCPGPRAAASCPGAACPCPRAAAAACPRAGQCPAGKACPLAQPQAAAADSPLPTACPSGAACAACPNAATCPLGGANPAAAQPK